jgi:hypothetical protein
MLPQKREPLSCACCATGRAGRARRGWEGAAGALSVGVWVFMPKCPLCLAAHLALWTGLGLSISQATYFRWALLALSASMLSYLTVKWMVMTSRRIV